MYAVLLWDRTRGQLVGLRDPAGEKHLATAPSRDVRVLASVPAGVCRLLIASGVDVGAGDLSETIRDGCGSNSIGHVGSIAPNEFVTVPGEPALPKLHPCDVDRLRGLSAGELTPVVERAVASRLEADVPLGVFLSGGLDSAIIAAIAVRHRPDLKAFTVRMPQPDTGPAYDESDAAAETAHAIGVEHHILDCEPDPAGDLVTLIEHLGLPFGDSSLLPTYWVAKAAREHITVALAGDGGDELFGGYRRHTINPVLNRWRRLLALVPDRLLDRRQPGSRSTYLARLAAAARYGGYCELLAIFPRSDLRRLLRMTEDDLPGYAGTDWTDDPLRYDFESYLPNDLLRKTDTASMAVALEVRAPFLARELVEAAHRTPLDVLMPGGERKGLLKQVARRFLPDTVIDRPKQGFAIPIGHWFRTDYGGLRQLLHDHLRSADPFPGFAAAGVEINTAFVRRMLREHDQAGERSLSPWHGRDHSQRLYLLLVLSIWSKWLARLRSDEGGSA